MSDTQAIAARLNDIQVRLRMSLYSVDRRTQLNNYEADPIADLLFLSAHVETLTQQAAQAEQQRDAAHAALKQRVVWIVAEYEGGGLIGAFGSKEGAEARIAEQLAEYTDMERSDYIIIRERIRGLDAALAASAPKKD